MHVPGQFGGRVPRQVAATVVAFLARCSTADFPFFSTPRYKLMARRSVTNRCFVSVERPRQWRLLSARTPARQIKTFPTEAEAKEYAKEMLSDANKIIAGTLLSADQTARRIISGWHLRRWTEEVS
jgi:hypothetical protein